MRQSNSEISRKSQLIKYLGFPKPAGKRKGVSRRNGGKIEVFLIIGAKIRHGSVKA